MKAIEEKLKKEEKKKQGAVGPLKPVAKPVPKPKAVTDKKVMEKKEIKLAGSSKKKKQLIENK